MKKLYLIDWNSLIYRMFFAVPAFSTTAGKQVNAIFWVAKFFLGQMRQESPDYLIFVRDAKWDNFRHQVYTEYKAQRERMPDSLKSQVDDINDMVNKMGFEVIEISWYEADDVIATLAKKYESEYQIYILSWDKDLHSLVNDNVKIYDTLKRKIYWPKDTEEKFEVPPTLVTDYLAIVWDSSDNFPGVAGVWPKKAVVLLNALGWMEKIYEIIDRIHAGEKVQDIQECQWNDELQKILSGKTLEKFIEWRELAFISKKLATLECSVPLHDFSLEQYQFHPEKIVTQEVKELFQSFEFKSLVDIESVSSLKTWSDTGLIVHIIGDNESLISLEKLMFSYSEIVFDTETTSIDPIQADLVWVSIYLDDAHIYYINVLHEWPKVDVDMLQEFLKRLFERDIKIIGHNIKYDIEVVRGFLSNFQKRSLEKTQSSLF